MEYLGRKHPQDDRYIWLCSGTKDKSTTEEMVVFLEAAGKVAGVSEPYKVTQNSGSQKNGYSEGTFVHKDIADPVTMFLFGSDDFLVSQYRHQQARLIYERNIEKLNDPSFDRNNPSWIKVRAREMDEWQRREWQFRDDMEAHAKDRLLPPVKYMRAIELPAGKAFTLYSAEPPKTPGK